MPVTRQGLFTSTSSDVIVFIEAGMLWTDRASPPGMSSATQVSVIVSPASTRPFDLYHFALYSLPRIVIHSSRSSTMPGGRDKSFLARSFGIVTHRVWLSTWGSVGYLVPSGDTIWPVASTTARSSSSLTSLKVAVVSLVNVGVTVFSLKTTVVPGL